MPLNSKESAKTRCLIIAEAGVNHNGSLEMALKMVDAAKDAGADAIKFQTFRAEKLVSPDAGMAEYQKINTGGGKSQYEMLKSLELSREDHAKIFACCRKKGLMFLSTPFDEESADFLDKLGVAIFKLGSGEITNTPLLRHIARKGRPMIISTGMADIAEIRRAVNSIRKINSKITLLHCTTSYPADFAELNLNAIATLKRIFRLPVGYSDHSEGIEASIAAVALGACVLEKHFTLDRNLPGPDHRASIEPGCLAKLVECARNVEKALGTGEKKPSASEKRIMCSVRRSIFAKSAIPKGAVISLEMLEFKRPGTGIPPHMASRIIGRKAKAEILSGEMLKRSDIK